MASRNITLSVDFNLYKKYKKFCKLKGLVASRQVEIMMENQMENKK